jgi:hypothetical protein
MDVNLLRRILTLSVALDEDPFCDFAFGFITGKTAQATETFVDNIIKATQMELPKRYVQPAVISKGKSHITEYGGHPIIHNAGYQGKAIALCTIEEDKDVLSFVKNNISELNGGGIISFGGCGDPEGIWLFSDHRNSDDTKHWDYSPEKVGYDPKGEMPRLMASDFKNLQLFPTVCWSGVCHMGAIQNVYVMGDIVSTFGRVKQITLHKMPIEKSLALALIEKGVVAMSCAISANHGFRVLIEESYAFETGAPLGDVLRAGYHDLVMTNNEGRLQGVGTFKQGANLYDKEINSVLWGVPQNRLLYGDPFYKPFKAVDDQYKYQVTKVITFTDKADFEVSCTMKDKMGALYKTTVINEFDVKLRSRIYCSVEVPVNFRSLNVKKVTATNAKGEALLISSVVALLEFIDGKHFLHLSARAPADTFKDAGITLKYEVKVNN